MAEFELDTSGKAYKSISATSMEAVYWDDLEGFVRGYVKALFAYLNGIIALEAQQQAVTLDLPKAVFRPARFADLAPEALAHILADCAQAAEIAGTPGSEKDGETFWALRQQGWQGFPPYRGDDGKVYLS